MNYTRLALAAVAATVVDFVYGYVVYGNLLASELERYPGVFRSMENVTPYLPLMFAGLLVGMLAVVWIYAKGYEGGNGTQEGLRFGLVMAVFVTGYVVVGYYATLNIGRLAAVYMALASIVEWILVGLAIGLVYRPGAASSTTARRAGA